MGQCAFCERGTEFLNNAWQKVKLSPRGRHERIWEVEVQLISFLISALDGVVVGCASWPVYPQGKHSGFSLNTSLVDPRPILDAWDGAGSSAAIPE